MDKIIIVDKNDKALGLEDKLKCHLGTGILHRAFSVFIFNKKGELLIQQRSAKKILWPLYWSNTCCGHPLEGEDYQQAAERRLREEMGFTCPVKYIGKFQYQAKYKDIGSENEICAVLKGEYNGDVIINLDEVADWKWINFDELKKDVIINSNKYTPWFKMELEKFFKVNVNEMTQ
jgi:isopentenyl-diphosphate delta-isomerase